MKSFFLAITHKIKHVKQLIKSGFYTALYAIFSGLAYAQTANPFGGSDDLLPTEAKGKGLFPQMIIIFAYVLRLVSSKFLLLITLLYLYKYNYNLNSPIRK